MISVYTPSHDARFLDEAYDSLKDQTVSDWQWSVVLNRGARWTPPPDMRVKVCHRDVDGVGAAKQAAVAECTGDVLVELDHDDLLAPTALERVADALDGDAGFVYSDTAQVEEDGGYCPDMFNVANGWQYSDEEVLDRNVMRCHSLEATPHNVSTIWYAPNHVRAFTRTAYDAAGGYSDRTVLDDQELMSRLYQHTAFRRVDECLYLQRMHKANTQRDSATNARIQVETIELYDEHVQANALAWASREGLAALDLGAAHNKPAGYIGVDLYEGDGVDVVADVTDGLPFDDSSVGLIRCVDFIEHLPDMVAFMNEAYRVLAHGGLLLTLTPSTDGRGAFCDPTHINFINDLSWRYYTDARFKAYVPTIKCRFQESRLVTYMPSTWHAENNVPYSCFNGVAIKDGARQGGELKC